MDDSPLQFKERSQSQPLRVDYEDGIISFITRRTIASRLIFANNNQLKERMLGAFGKYVTKYAPKVYAYIIYGSHDHLLVDFQPRTKINFFRDFGSRTTEAVRMYVDSFEGGQLFERRPSEQAIAPTGIVDQFWYTVLQPVKDGLCRRISQYPGYNCFEDAVSGKPLEVKFINWAPYRAAKRKNPDVSIDKFTEVHKINFERLPGYEHYTQAEYRAEMRRELERRQSDIVRELEAAGHKFPTPESLKQVNATMKAKNPKKSGRHDKRPLILTTCELTRKAFLAWYFSLLERYKLASRAYLNGDMQATFPPGTCRPPGPLAA